MNSFLCKLFGICGTNRENPSFDPSDQLIDEMIALRNTIGKTFRLGKFPLMQHCLHRRATSRGTVPEPFTFHFLTEGEIFRLPV